MPVIGSLLWWKPSSSWVSFLVVLCLGILVGEIAVRLRSGDKIIGTLATGAAMKRIAIITIIPAISIIVFGGMCFWAGYGWRDHELTMNVRTLLNVDVLEAYPAGNYGMRTETGTAFPLYPCPAPDGSVTVRFHPGSRLKILTYERRPDCFIVKYFLPDIDQTGRLKGEFANARE